MPNRSSKFPTAGSSSPKAVNTGFFWTELRGKYDIHRSIFVSRRILSSFRVIFAIYFLITLFLSLSQCKNYYELLQISRWSFLVQTIYYIQAAHQSLKGRSSPQEEEPDWKITHILYEVAFSFQLFNFVYYWVFIFSSNISWQTISIDWIIEFHLNVVSFIAIWCDQLFNLMRFYLMHFWLVGSLAVLNLLLTVALSEHNINLVYGNIDLHTLKGISFGLLMLVLPMVHFVEGYSHSEYKRKRKNNRRKYLGEQLVSLRKSHYNMIDDS